MDKLGNILICAGGCISLGNWFFNTFTFTLPEDKYAILARQKRNEFQAKYLKQKDKFVDDFQKLKSISKPGIYFFIPFRKSLTFYDKISNHTIILQKILNQEPKPVDISLSLNYSLEPQKLPLLHEIYGDDYQFDLIDKKVSKLIQQLLKKYNMQFLTTNKKQFENEVLMKSNQIMEKYCKINNSQLITIKYSVAREDKVQEQVQKLKKIEQQEKEKNVSLVKEKEKVEKKLFDQLAIIRNNYLKKYNLEN